ncbi:uncharacterized protein LOC111714468 [Eurytemora carolleeae]|uniref:uncharacterized protein LOC111714468 n=1 Tax=Eurytemora carolleeae TaxID=1294199 RepID=UPI000C7562BD|nr:uncharacterized protein LOC111714468 [Eurytemora carolleeae]|eukprot:XP_023345349.1 uncharacterized protein LOC111714468 [Eurytemora affinis]
MNVITNYQTTLRSRLQRTNTEIELRILEPLSEKMKKGSWNTSSPHLHVKTSSDSSSPLFSIPTFNFPAASPNRFSSNSSIPTIIKPNLPYQPYSLYTRNTAPSTAPLHRRAQSLETKNMNSTRYSRGRRLSTSESGKLNPSLYLSSSSGEINQENTGDELFGKVYLIANFSEGVLKIRLKKLKLNSGDYNNIGIYVRLQLLPGSGENFQSSTQFGEEKRNFNEDFFFNIKESRTVSLWGVVYESDIKPRVLTNFYRTIRAYGENLIIRCALRHDTSETFIEDDIKRIELQIALKYIDSEGKMSIIVHKCKLPNSLIEISQSLYIKIWFGFLLKQLWFGFPKTTLVWFPLSSFDLDSN